MTAIPRAAFRKPSILPGFGLTFGLTLTWLGLIVLIPLASLFLHTASLSFEEFRAIVTDERVLAALRLSFGLALAAAAINLVFGLVVVWTLVRYDFPGRSVADAIIDVPFALPTAVAGIALSALYSPNGWLGSLFAPFGIKIAYTPVGILLALVFVGLPFVVRTVQPVLQDLDAAQEEAAATLGAGRGQTFLRVILPALTPSLLTGFALAFARGVGEYGSVIFIAGNIPHVSEIAPLLIVTRLEEFAWAEATAIATVMLVAAFLILLAINLLQRRSELRAGSGSA